jgi:hypothetical protein
MVGEPTDTQAQGSTQCAGLLPRPLDNRRHGLCSLPYVAFNQVGRKRCTESASEVQHPIISRDDRAWPGLEASSASTEKVKRTLFIMMAQHVGTDHLSPELAQLLANPRTESDRHVNDQGDCALCREPACLAAFTLSAL